MDSISLPKLSASGQVRYLNALLQQLHPDDAKALQEVVAWMSTCVPPNQNVPKELILRWVWEVKYKQQKHREIVNQKIIQFPLLRRKIGRA